MMQSRQTLETLDSSALRPVGQRADHAGEPTKMTQGPPEPLIAAGLLLGVGLGGFFDGIVLHQILQWHHMLSSVGTFPVDTIAGLRANTLWDGIFHAATYLATVASLLLLWHSARLPHEPWPTALLVGLFLMGWGGFNLIEGVINHHLLGLHHVNETAPREQWLRWDLGFLLWGVIMLIAGAALVRADRNAPSPRA